MLSYAVLPRELLVWIDRPRPIRAASRSGDGVRLEAGRLGFSGRCCDASANRTPPLRSGLYRLSGRFGQPLQRGANLIVIPDRWLHFVPFVAFRDPATGRFLVRDHAVSYAPSATLLMSSLARPQQRFSHDVEGAGGRQSRVRPAGISTSGSARRRGEARGSRRSMPIRSPLVGRDATDAALERMAPRFDILHFAGHAVVGRKRRSCPTWCSARTAAARRGVLDGDRQVEAARARDS